MKEMKRCKASLSNVPKTAPKIVKQTVGKTSVEDISIFLNRKSGKDYKKPDAANGKKVINKVGCIGCHNIAPGQVVKAPDLSKLGKVSKDDIAMSIVRPADIIAKTWVNITTKKGALHMGTIVKRSSKEITLHNIAGMKTVFKTSDLKKVEPGSSMMLLHLCDALTLQEFADLIEYVQSLDPKYKQ